MMLIAVRRSFITSWVDKYGLTAALPNSVQLFVHVGAGRHHGAIRDLWVGSQHQEIIGAVDIGDRGEELMSQHVVPSKVMRHLVTG